MHCNRTTASVDRRTVRQHLRANGIITMFCKLLVFGVLVGFASAAAKPGVGHGLAIAAPIAAAPAFGYSAGIGYGAAPIAAAPALAYGSAFGQGAGFAAQYAAPIAASSYAGPALAYGAGYGPAGLGFGYGFGGLGRTIGLNYGGLSRAAGIGYAGAYGYPGLANALY